MPKGKKKRNLVILFVLVFILISILIGGYFYYKSWNYTQGIKLADEAVFYINEGDYKMAEENLNQAILKVDKENKIAIAIIYKNKAILNEYKNEIDLAVENYQNAQALFTESESEYFSFGGIVNLFERDINGAVDNFNKALKIDPDNFDAHNYLGLLYLGELILDVEPNHEMALPHNKKAYELEESIKTIQNLALNYYLLDKYDEALLLFNKINSIVDDDGLTKLFIGLIYFNKRDFLPTKEYLEKAIELDSNLNTEEIQLILTESNEALKEMGIE